MLCAPPPLLPPPLRMAATNQAPAPVLPLAGRVAIVTGANSGIGYETALELASRGAHVVLACRRVEAAETAAAAMRAAVTTHACAVEVLELDLASLASVRAFAGAFQARHGALHLLVNNAGCNFWGKEKPFYTEEGVGGCAQINFRASPCAARVVLLAPRRPDAPPAVGCYALTRLLSGTMLASAPSRVVTVTSVMHRAGTLRRGAARFGLRGQRRRRHGRWRPCRGTRRRRRRLCWSSQCNARTGRCVMCPLDTALKT